MTELYLYFSMAWFVIKPRHNFTFYWTFFQRRAVRLLWLVMSSITFFLVDGNWKWFVRNAVLRKKGKLNRSCTYCMKHTVWCCQKQHSDQTDHRCELIEAQLCNAAHIELTIDCRSDFSKVTRVYVTSKPCTVSVAFKYHVSKWRRSHLVSTEQRVQPTAKNFAYVRPIKWGVVRLYN